MSNENENFTLNHQVNLRPIFHSRKSIWVLGVANFLLFVFAITALFVFFWDTSSNFLTKEHEFKSWPKALLINFLFMTWFNVGHSLLLESKWKTRLSFLAPISLAPVIYSIHASLSLLVMIYLWQPFGDQIYSTFSGPLYILIAFFYVASWLMMGYAMYSLGFFRQSGMEHWWSFLNSRPLKNDLVYDRAFQLCRHPIYFAFLGMIWFTPVMTWDHLFLAIYWTAYIIYGAYMKEKRLARNKTYADYMKKVPAFPLLPKRPLHELMFPFKKASVIFVFIYISVFSSPAFAEKIEGVKKYETLDEVQMRSCIVWL